MSRVAAALAVIGLAVIGVASPAWGHATIATASTVPSNSEQRVTMDVPEERGDTVHHKSIKVYLPPDWTGLACEAAAPWRCVVTPNALEGRTLVEWTNSSGTPVTETFTFTARTGAPGRYSMPVAQTYSPTDTSNWAGEEGSDTPAPFITVTAAAATTTAPPPTTAPPGPTTTAPPAASTTTRPGATTTTAAGATTTTVAGETTTTTAVDDTSTTTSTTEATTTTTAASDDEQDGEDDGSALPWLLAAIVVLGGGAAAIAYAVRRRRAAPPGPPTDAPAPPDPPAPTDETRNIP